MAINQLFKNKPNYQLVNIICSFFKINLNNLQLNNSFTINSINESDLENIKQRLNEFYLPCKKKNYLDNITKKKQLLYYVNY